MVRFSLEINDRHPYLKKITSDFIQKFSAKGNVYDQKHPEVIFVFGGDGSLLRAIRSHIGENVSFMLVNDGNLGFYKEYELAETDNLISSFDEKNLEKEEHHFIQIEDEYGHKALACNEFMLASSFKTLHFLVYMNGEYFMEVRGSGICIASPFGSSGYNHSLGGALLPYDEGMALSLLAPIRNRSFHPLISSLVTGDKDVVGIEFLASDSYDLAADMKLVTDMEGNRFSIKKSSQTFCLVHSKPFDPYQRIRKSFLE
jgi:NAD+ kinase